MLIKQEQSCYREWEAHILTAQSGVIRVIFTDLSKVYRELVGLMTTYERAGLGSKDEIKIVGILEISPTIKRKMEKENH